MSHAFLISHETANESATRLGSLYWQFESDGRWSYTVNEIAAHFSIAPHEVSKIISSAAPIFVISRRCSSCGLPFRVNNRTEFSALEKDSSDICKVCREAKAAIAMAKREELARQEREQQTKIWIEETSYDPGTTYRGLEFSEIIEAFAIFLGSEADQDGNLRFPSSPPFTPESDGLQKILKRLYDEEVVLIGKGTPTNAFVPGESEQSYEYYPAKVVWRFATRFCYIEQRRTRVSLPY